jgi:hypothetical protein
MLAQVLEKRGVGVRVVPSRQVSSGNILRLDVEGGETVVISYRDPAGWRMHGIWCGACAAAFPPA